MSTQSPVLPHGSVPEYVPPHLRDKVWDFRNEPDGTVSFLHPEAAMGLSPEDSRVKLNKEQYRDTFDPIDRGGDIFGSMNNQYAPMQRKPKTFQRQANEWIGQKLGDAYRWGTSAQGKAVGTSGVLLGLLGGLGGYAWGSRSGSPLKKALLLSLLAGGVGAAATAYGQNRHNNRENWLSKDASMDIATSIIRILEDDPSLSNYDRATILRAVAQMRNPDRSDLYHLLKTSLGAGAGVLAMRFLGAKGLLPMLAGGILGGLLGGGGRNRLARNALGQVSITNYL